MEALRRVLVTVQYWPMTCYKITTAFTWNDSLEGENRCHVSMKNVRNNWETCFKEKKVWMLFF